MPRPPRRNRGGDIFAIGAALAALAAASAYQQGGTIGWAMLIVMGVLAAVLGCLAWVGWTAPRGDDQ